MTREEQAWATVVAAATALEIWAVKRKNEATLSYITRRVFRTETTVGRAVFGASWVLFAGWMLRHILEGSRSTL